MAETPRIEVVLYREFSEPVECPRYSGPPMFATDCWITWRSEADWAGNHFSVKVAGARRKKDGQPYSERIVAEGFHGKHVLPWLERAGVTETTVANALLVASRQIREGQS